MFRTSGKENSFKFPAQFKAGNQPHQMDLFASIFWRIGDCVPPSGEEQSIAVMPWLTPEVGGGQTDAA